MRYVIDASTAVRWYATEFTHPHADAVLSAFIDSPERFAIPELFAYEVLNALYRVVPDAHSIYANEVNWILRSGILRYPMTDHIFDRIWLTFDARACRLLGDGELAMNLNEINPFPK